VAVLLVPSPAMPEPTGPRPGAGAPPAFEAPLPAVANDPAAPLVESNPFDASRKPPAQRHTATTSEVTDPDLQQNLGGANFLLLGTVMTLNGRDIAVIQTPGGTPGGTTFHVGEEPMPGFRVTRITRTGATIVGGGQTFELEVRKAGEEGAMDRGRRFGPGADQAPYDEAQYEDEEMEE